MSIFGNHKTGVALQVIEKFKFFAWKMRKFRRKYWRSIGYILTLPFSVIIVDLKWYFTFINNDIIELCSATILYPVPYEVFKMNFVVITREFVL